MTRRYRWLLAAAILLMLAALLMTRRTQAPDAAPRTVEFPRTMRPEEFRRVESRKTLTPPPAATAAGPERQSRRDPLLAALPSGKGRTVVVIEANAIRHSPIGELLLRCLAAEERGDPIAQFREETGIDLLTDLDRIAVTENGMIVSGNFQNARWDKSLGEMRSAAYGDHSTLFGSGPHPLPDGGQAEPGMAIWNGQLFIVGESADQVRSAVDRVEGRSPVGPPAIPEQSSYGEIYGVLSADQLVPMISAQDPAMAEKLRQVAERIEIHVDARTDVALVAEVSGSDAAAVNDLAKSLGAMLSLGRVHARMQQDENLAELLDLARIEPGQGRFNLELALPMEFLEKQLASCRPKDGARAESRP